MTTLERVRALFRAGQTVRIVQNTYRPALNGSLRRLTRVATTKVDCEILTGPGAGKPGFQMRLPTRARDVVCLTDTAVTYKLGRGDHTVTISTELDPQATPNEEPALLVEDASSIEADRSQCNAVAADHATAPATTENLR